MKLSLLTLFLFGTIGLHDFFISILTIRHKSDTHTLDLTWRITAHDLEHALESVAPLKLGSDKEHPKADSLINAYFNQHLVLDGELLPEDDLDALSQLRNLAHGAGEAAITLLWPAERACDRVLLSQCGARHVLQRPVSTERLVEAVLWGNGVAGARRRQSAAAPAEPSDSRGIAA